MLKGDDHRRIMAKDVLRRPPLKSPPLALLCTSPLRVEGRGATQNHRVPLLSQRKEPMAMSPKSFRPCAWWACGLQQFLHLTSGGCRLPQKLPTGTQG